VIAKQFLRRQDKREKAQSFYPHSTTTVFFLRAPAAIAVHPSLLSHKLYRSCLVAQRPYTGAPVILLWNFLATRWKLIKTQQSMKRGCMRV
jgi:hypothetical protein